jgi:superfamily II DNA helicase RecQ
MFLTAALALLLPALLLLPGELASAKSVVVYAGFKAAADSLAAQLQRAQVTARPYHAGLTMQQREAVQVGAADVAAQLGWHNCVC